MDAFGHLGVPTLAEAGCAGDGFVAWQGLFAPAGALPEALRTRWAALDGTFKSAELRSRLQQAGSVELPRGPDEIGRYYRSVVQRWARLFMAGKLAALP